MTDDSAIEQRAIRLAFPSLNAGEQEVAHLLCSVHSNRTLLRRLGSTGFRMHLSGQCMLGSIALSSFKPLLQTPVRHGIV
ncbi:hypothetical protein BGX38DRAFT_1216159, partial [Terfezia claveryi]